MVGNGNHPLDTRHYDDYTLEEYVLGMLLPDEEDEIRQHLSVCGSCRAKASDIEQVCRRVTYDLHHELDGAQPKSPLSFDQIASEWHRPPRRVQWPYRLQRALPNPSIAVLVLLFIATFIVLTPNSDAAYLRRLDLVTEYHGPTVKVAATTADGLLIARLASDDVQAIDFIQEITLTRHLVFSPDGNWLAVQQDDTLHIIEARSSGAHIQVELNGTGHWAWSPSSDELAYTDGTGQLVLFDTRTQGNRVLVPVSEGAWGQPVWASGGDSIAYASVVPLPSSGRTIRWQSIWRLDPVTGYRVELARNSAPDDMILVPAAWFADDRYLLAWDISAAASGDMPTLYRVDSAQHELVALEEQALAQGTELLWQINAEDTMIAEVDERLVMLHLADGTHEVLPNQIPWPYTVDWAPNGAWLAYIANGAVDGLGLYVYTPEQGLLKSLRMPRGAAEKSVMWAGAEHLFVVRQPDNKQISELWLVPLTSGEPPLRILTNARVPRMTSYQDWEWSDVLAVQVVE